MEHLINMLQFGQHLPPPSYHGDIILTNSSLIFNENYASDRRAEEQPHYKGFREVHKDIFAQSHQFPPSLYVLFVTRKCEHSGARSLHDARRGLHTAIVGCHFFNTECHNGSTRMG
jgi:hypothetical protein